MPKLDHCEERDAKTELGRAQILNGRINFTDAFRKNPTRPAGGTLRPAGAAYATGDSLEIEYRRADNLIAGARWIFLMQ